MLRGEVAKGLDHDPNFHWRGDAVTRIENLSDIAFALALGMLVAGSGTPQTFDDLGRFLFSIMPVAAGFSVLLGLWHSHFTFFRRYGVADNHIICLNAALIFVVLYIAYPLRFAFDSFLAFILMQLGDGTMMETLGIKTFDMSGIIIAYYGLAYAVIQLLMMLMYVHALRKRELLALNSHEVSVTKREVFTHSFLMVFSIVVAALAYFTWLNGIAGCLFFITFLPYMIAKRIFPDVMKHEKTKLNDLQQSQNIL